MICEKAPLITLFGERLTKQFLSESISLLDNVIFALSPLGVLTAVVSVIRVCDSSSLRAFIGRAQEGPAEAESELLPCVSESTAELFNDGGVSRVFGRPKIVEIVAWEKDGPKTGEKSVEIGTLRQALQKGAWSASSKGAELTPEDLWDLTRLPALDIPNLSLNKGIKRRDQRWFYCTAILGAMLQAGVIIYAAITVFIFPASFKKDDKAVPAYASPFYIIGTVFLFVGMLYCAIIIERSSKEYYLKPNKQSKLYWLQPGNQHVGDQVFNAFMAVKAGPNSGMTMDLEYIKSTRIRKYDGRYVEIYSTLFFTMLGFIIQFIGLRGLHASVILAQLGATFLMSVLRTCLRTQRMAPEENKLKNERSLTSLKRQELDSFIFHLENIESFGLVSSLRQETPTDSSSDSSRTMLPQENCQLNRIIEARSRLAELTSSGHGLIVAWDDMPIRKSAQNLAATIETTMDLMSNWGAAFGKKFEFPLSFECNTHSTGSINRIHGTYPVRLLRCGDALRWRIDMNELEAIIGLWSWSLYKSDEEWSQPLNRLVGLSADEASKEETYLYFHKWIFRQTEARMVSSDMIDTKSRLFGLDSERHPQDKDVLIVRTQNCVEKMAALDIYTHFIQCVLRHVTTLGGDVDIEPHSMNSYLAQSSRINELMHCFEDCELGTREDALQCIVPVLRDQDLLPELAADSVTIRRRTEALLAQNNWESALSMTMWICQRSEGAELERSVYELGYLCRRALLSKEKAAQEQGLIYLSRILKASPRHDFLQSQAMRQPTHWGESPEFIQWWHAFSQQMGWLAWRISVNVPTLKWIQPDLKRLNTTESLTLPRAAEQSAEDIDQGRLALEEWLTLDHIDFARQLSGIEDELGFKWARQGGFNGLLYFFMMRLAEVGAKCPTLIQHAYVLAAKNHSSWAVQVLQSHEADINTLSGNNVSALVDVTVSEDILAVKTLLANGADPNGDDKAPDGRPLILAANLGFTKIVELLLQHGAIHELTDSIGLTALQWASREDRRDTAALLLSYGAEVDQIGSDHLTPLHSAVLSNQCHMAALLLENGANINAAEASFWLTPLMMAARSSFVEVLHLLLAMGADMYTRDVQGQTALDWARQNGCDETAAILEKAMQPP
ncbi:hypothetical protein N7492_006529 [Penicillium capsulatum]|uniref:Uncharacterized protein n=1 Tax=Penicillium capsulatum TaxID=69766 RepID=A0A9W9HY50_9EURO|nr:hypothetical protein N7492_006529 [Penicillium capsulatum]